VELRLADVFRTSPASLLSRMFRTAAQMTAGIPPGVDPIQGMVDTTPLQAFLRRVLNTPDGFAAGRWPPTSAAGESTRWPSRPRATPPRRA